MWAPAVYAVFILILMRLFGRPCVVARCLRCFYIDFDEVIRATTQGRPYGL